MHIPSPEKFIKFYREMEIQKILNRIDENEKKLKGFPHFTKNGGWVTTEDGCWTGGFWIGLLWLAHELSGNKRYLELAYKWLEKLRERKSDKTFDLGFLFYPSFVLGYKLTNDTHLRREALDAADTLATLFHEKSNFVYVEDILKGKKIGRTIIDVMMNLPLLWWAFEETGDREYFDVAYKHSKSALENFIRDDYSTIHAIYFDLETGKIVRKMTIQGYGPDSCWSRGQAWGIYGFSLAYQASKEREFLRAAEGLSDYFIRWLPSDNVPYWDFDDSKIPDAVRDSSAAAITCSGLLTLSKLNRKEKFKDVAFKMLNSLSTNYLAEGSDGILKHGCYHKPENIGVDESLIWGDYYFVEALTKILRERE